MNYVWLQFHCWALQNWAVKKKKKKEGGSWVKREVVNSKQNSTVSCYLLMQMNIFEAAVETGVKLKSRDCVKGQQFSMPVDAALSSPERHISEQTPPLCTF